MRRIMRRRREREWRKCDVVTERRGVMRRMRHQICVREIESEDIIDERKLINQNRP
jgi:hypothetical protein